MTAGASAERLAQMQQDWEQRADQNPMYHIDARKVQWQMDEFYAGGEAIVAQSIDPVLARFNIDPTGKSVVEIGPGMGRLFPALTKRFGSVTGVEISTKMIALGQEHCPVRASARWIAGDGGSLTGVPDASVDYVVSFEVFQHIPSVEPIWTYLAETHRVLRPGASFQLQLRKGSDSRGQAAFRHLPMALQPDALKRAAGLGFEQLAIVDDDLHPAGMGYWLVGHKPML
jgi:cyclopropane fatty-acyl-phospholipid synthase-like methyltransferase